MGGCTCIFPGSDNHPEASSAVTIYKCMPVLGCFLYDIVMDTVTLLRYSRHFVDTITPTRTCTCTYMCIYYTVEVKKTFPKTFTRLPVSFQNG